MSKTKSKENNLEFNENNINTKDNRLEFNTYCIFKNEEQDVNQIIGLIFKDYIGRLKAKTK